LVGVVLTVGLAPSAVTAQDMDARWLPWLGCWEAVEGADDAPLLCVRAATEGNGVDFVTWSGGEITASETILADGILRDVEREECQGTEKAEFSDNGHRVYLNSNYVCEGDVQRAASGILAMVNPMEWVDIKAVDGSPWVLRYRLARASKVKEAGMETVGASRAADVKSARIAASTRLTEADIIETVGKVDGAAVEALIVERGDPFHVDADLLVRLHEAGVPSRVIDLVVAISYPDRFAVKAGPMPVEEYADETQPRRTMYMAGAYYDPWMFGYGYPYSYYSRYGYGYGLYSPYYYGGYGYGYNYTPIVVTTRTAPRGSMIKGQGYTRGGSSYGGTRGYAQPRSSSGGGSAASGGGSRSAGSSAGRSAKPRGGGGTVSSGSSTSRSTGRTAKPRGGGGGLF
jgi:hypothetical protein